jgi:hypothetical protein
VLLRVVLRRVCTRLRFDGERRPLAGRDGVIVIWRVQRRDMRLLTQEKCSGKRRLAAFEKDPG